VSTAHVVAAYQDGAHVRLKYAVEGEGLPAPDAAGAFVVEYLRCGGWEWVPVRVFFLLLGRWDVLMRLLC
jgi:hypothetical protein